MKAVLCLTTVFLHLCTCCPSLENAEYYILGPFPSAGDHFAGGDPLEAFGGITQIPVRGDSIFHSELVVGGKVRWQRIYAGESSRRSTVLHQSWIV